jgi:hypothetical protein
MKDQTDFVISKDIPIPPARKGRWRKLPYLELEVGESFANEYYVDVKRLKAPEGYSYRCAKVIEDGQARFRVWRLT